MNYAELDTATECENVTDLSNLSRILLAKNRNNWRLEVPRKSKLRTFEQIHDFSSEKTMLKANLDRGHRSLVTKLKSGVFPVRLEMGRYKGLKIHERICELCGESTEDEIHFLFVCPRLKWTREYFTKPFKREHSECNELSNMEFLKLLLTPEYIRELAKWLESMYNARRDSIYRTC